MKKEKKGNSTRRPSRKPSRIEGIAATLIALAAGAWFIMDLIQEAPIFFSLFGALVAYFAGVEAYRYWSGRWENKKRAREGSGGQEKDSKDER